MCPSSLNILRIHCHHWLASLSKWYAAMETFLASVVPWYSKNWCTRLNHSVGSSPANHGNSSFAVLAKTICRPPSLPGWLSWLGFSWFVINTVQSRLSVSSIRSNPSWTTPSLDSKCSIHSLLVPIWKPGTDTNNRSQTQSVKG